jgi:hypothetical protein
MDGSPRDLFGIALGVTLDVDVENAVQEVYCLGVVLQIYAKYSAFKKGSKSFMVFNLRTEGSADRQ